MLVLQIITLTLLPCLLHANFVNDDLIQHSDAAFFDSDIFLDHNAIKDKHGTPVEALGDNEEMPFKLQKKYGIGPHHRVSAFDLISHVTSPRALLSLA